MESHQNHHTIEARWRSIVRTGMLTTISMVVALLLLEGIVRIIEPREVMRYFFMQSDTLVHHSFLPGASGRYKTTEFDVGYTINAHGLRDSERPLAKPAGTGRIMMLGDSFTEGDGVEYGETFSARLEAFLDTVPLPLRWEVINAGVGSYSPLLEYLFLVHRGLALDPDVVIVNLDLSDVFDDLSYAATTRYDATGIPVAAREAPEPRPDNWLVAGLVDVKDFFKENARLYNFIRLRIDRYLEGARHTVDVSGNIRVDKYAMLREGYNADFAKECALTFRHLLLIRDTLQARGIHFRVTLYPYGHQISPTEWHAGRQFWGFRPDTVYGIEPQAKIEAWCRANDIPVTNLSEAFRRAASRQSPLYHDYNGHWLPAGHEIVAQELSRAILPELERRRPR